MDLESFDISNKPIARNIVFIIAGLVTIIFFDKESLAIAGFFILLFGLLSLIYELRMRYKINHFDHNKEYIRMKSSGERFIADWLNRRHIKYEYEDKLKIGKHTYTPDFYLPEFNIYIEYWGMWDQGDKIYREEVRDKKEAYKKEGIKLVELYPEHIRSNKLDWTLVNRLLKVLKQR